VNSTHTEGPWYVDPNDHPLYVRAPGGGTVAHCDEAFHIHRGDANARLIAAAPDLLAACKQMVSEFESIAVTLGADTSKNPVLVAARAAIAKAEGGAA